MPPSWVFHSVYMDDWYTSHFSSHVSQIWYFLPLRGTGKSSISVIIQTQVGDTIDGIPGRMENATRVSFSHLQLPCALLDQWPSPRFPMHIVGLAWWKKMQILSGCASQAPKKCDFLCLVWDQPWCFCSTEVVPMLCSVSCMFPLSGMDPVMSSSLQWPLCPPQWWDLIYGLRFPMQCQPLPPRDPSPSCWWYPVALTVGGEQFLN